LLTTTGVDVWRVTVTFDRARGQPYLMPAQRHPLTDEREDRVEYQRYKEEMCAAELAAEAVSGTQASLGIEGLALRDALEGSGKGNEPEKAE
jgi:hypothetical protein